MTPAVPAALYAALQKLPGAPLSAEAARGRDTRRCLHRQVLCID